MNMNAKEVINLYFNGGVNMVTPTIIKYIEKPPYCIELSKGDVMEYTMYGVTVVEKDGNNLIHRMDIDRCFYSYDEAVEYIDSLQYIKSGLVEYWKDVSYNNETFKLYASYRQGV